jgi:hypothetical protein
MADFQRLSPELVTDRNRSKAWEKWWADHRVSHDRWPTIHTPKYGPLWFKVAAKSPFYSFFGVMSFAIQEGATHMHVVGCSLAGQGYFDPIVSQLDRVRARPKRVWDSRWSKERAMLGRILAAAPENGVTFSGLDGVLSGP